MCTDSTRAIDKQTHELVRENFTMSIRFREERARGGDFFGFVSSVLSDVTGKLEGGFSDEGDRRNTIELLKRSR